MVTLTVIFIFGFNYRLLITITKQSKCKEGMVEVEADKTDTEWHYFV